MPYQEISLYALLGSPNPGKMRLIGFIKGVKAIVLLYIGSNHNFIDTSVVAKVALVLQRAIMEVKITNVCNKE